ncbi:hypothetical protein H0H81_003327 [Sphagnurus paluster]|uniref:Aminotransferase class I/classII large domain-containing protein n=1 Tax=Sphagnurus paluster TaxID=117069 RepID=A0A9P7FV00_9AGAR|nr:hypothetical protein H0H81_003327 [Sphagnurus paluster]
MHFHLPRVKSFTDIIEQVRDAIRHKHEKESEAHQASSVAESIFRQAAGHQPKGVNPEMVNPDEETVPGIEHPGSTGVIYCSDRAMANGFSYANSHEWANLGQGAPEVGPIPDAPARPNSIPIPVDSLEYAPTTGVKELREAVANLYNDTYRKEKTSKYTYENVCIVPGGRAGLTRVAAVIGDVYTSYQIPDYTAYDQVLSVFKRLVPVPTALDVKSKYKLDIEQTKRDIRNQGLAVILASNPRNPTGQVIKGHDLKELVALGREGTTVILDEFYSWYIYPDHDSGFGKSISSAKYIEDVNEDSVVIIDGLTKNAAGRDSSPGSCQSCSRKGAIQLGGHSGFAYAYDLNYQLALQRHFKAKRDHVLHRLRDLGLEVDLAPTSTFYIWLNLEKLPEPLNNGLVFFEELLKFKTIVIPGIFFDINPAHRRNLFNSPCHHFVRISFGPPIEDLDRGLDAIAMVLKQAKKVGPQNMGRGYVASESRDLDRSLTLILLDIRKASMA